MERYSRALGVACAAGLIAVGMASGPVAAQEFEIKSPLVEEGSLELEWHGGVQSRFPNEEEDEDDDEEGGGDDDEAVRQAHELSIGYGASNIWQPELALTLAQEKGDHLKVDAIGIENTFQLMPRDTYTINLGLLAAYEASVRDEIHSFEVGPLVEVPLGPLSNTINAIFGQQYGDDRESASTAFEYAWQTMFELVDDLDVGFEAFGEIESFADDAPSLDEQEHRIGPVGYYEADLGPFELSIGVGFLFGLTDETPNHTFKFDIELEWGGRPDSGYSYDDDDDDD